MKDKIVKAKIMKLLWVWPVAMLFIFGCAANKGDPVMSQQKNVDVLDLKNEPEYQSLLSGRPETCGMRSGRVYLLPGDSIGQHSTGQHEELLVFLSGQGLALIGEDEALPIGKGKVAYIPPHTAHNMKNTGTEPLIYIYCVAPVTDCD
jgi:mannose-6-phosphate isomerase-like protein (cupin superfamily)